MVGATTTLHGRSRPAHVGIARYGCGRSNGGGPQQQQRQRHGHDTKFDQYRVGSLAVIDENTVGSGPVHGLRDMATIAATNNTGSTISHDSDLRHFRIRHFAAEFRRPTTASERSPHTPSTGDGGLAVLHNHISFREGRARHSYKE